MNAKIRNICLKFECPANWNEMTPMAGGRFCNHCAKIVYDFTDAKQAEFARVMSQNNSGFCGRFRTEQMAPPSRFTYLKHWLSAALLTLTAGLLTHCKYKNKEHDKLTGLIMATPSEIKVVRDSFNFNARNNKPAPVKSKLKTPPLAITTGFIATKPIPDMVQRDVVVIEGDSTLNRDPVETNPAYPGGYGKLGEFIAANLKFPKDGTEQEGKVFIGFNIEADGTPTDFEVVRSFSKSFDEEALRVLKLMPKWFPGTEDGRPARMRQVIPINFIRPK